MPEIRVSGLTNVENSGNYGILQRLPIDKDTILVKSLLKIATKGNQVGTTSEYYTDVPPSIIFIEELLGEKVASSYLRHIETGDKDDNNQPIIKQEIIKDGFQYPNDGSDCIDVTKDILNCILGLSDKYTFTPEQIKNVMSFMLPYIKKQDPTSEGMNEDTVITYLKDRLKDMNSTEPMAKMAAEKVYNLLVIGAIEDAASEFSRNRTDILQWDIPTVIENFAPVEDKAAYGKEGYPEVISGVNVNSIYYQMNRVSDYINIVKYLCKKNSILLGLKVKDLIFNPEWKVGDKIILPEAYDNFKKEKQDPKYKHIYRNWVLKPKPKSTVFAFQTEVTQQKNALKDPTKFNVGYTQTTISKSANSNYSKFKSTLAVGKTNSHPDFVIMCEIYPPAADISSSAAAMSYSDPGDYVYDLIANQKELKKEVYLLFSILNKDVEHKCVRKLNKSLVFNDSIESFRNALNRVEDVNCQDEESAAFRGKTWLEKLLHFYPTIIQDNKELFVDMLGFKNPEEENKVDLNALDLDTPTNTTPQVTPEQQVSVTPAPQPAAQQVPITPIPEQQVPVTPVTQQMPIDTTQVTTEQQQTPLNGLGGGLTVTQ